MHDAHSGQDDLDPRPEGVPFRPGRTDAELPGAVGPGLGREGPAAARIQRPRRNSASSAIGQFFSRLIGTSLSGAVGLAIGYYLLSWLGGPQYNFFDLPLPGLPNGGRAVAERAALPPAGAVAPPAPPPAVKPADRAPAAEEPDPPATTTKPGAAESDGDKADAVTPQLSPDYVGPKNFTTRHPEELQDALLAAKAMLICDRCRATGVVVENGKPLRCDRCAGRTAGEITPEMITSLVQLSEIVGFVAPEPDEPSKLRQRDAIRGLLLRAAQDGDRQVAIAHDAERRFDSVDLSNEASAATTDDKRGAIGILLTGTVVKLERSGRVNVAKILLTDTNMVVEVVGRAPVPAKLGDRVIALGTIVRQPAEELIGYAGDAPIVIWSTAAVKLP